MTFTNNDPRPYDLAKPEELKRLFKEVRGYLETCKRFHHGTDFSGREHAIDALDTLLKLK